MYLILPIFALIIILIMKPGKYLLCIMILIPSFLYSQDKGKMDEKVVTYQNLPLFKPRFHLNLGSNYFYMPSFGGNMNMFASPSVSIPLSKRFSVEGGILASTSILPGFTPLEMNHSVRNFNSLSIYGSTIYQVTPKLTVYGTGIRQLMNTKLPFPYSPFNQNSFSVGSYLKLGNNITIGASFKMSDNNYFYSPFPSRNAGIINSPFAW